MVFTDKKIVSLISCIMICLLMMTILFYDAASLQGINGGTKSDLSFLGGIGKGYFICLPNEKSAEVSGGKGYFFPTLQSISNMPDIPNENSNYNEKLCVKSNIYNSTGVVSILQKKDGKK